MAKKAKSKKKYWAGFCGGKIDIVQERYSTKSYVLAIYLRKIDAQKYYEDVRPVTIEEVK